MPAGTHPPAGPGRHLATSRPTGDRAAKTIIQSVDFPDSDIDARTISVNGRVMQSRSKTGLVTTFAYDSLGRRTGITDPRTGTATIHHDSLGRVHFSEDAAGNTTVFGYDDRTGRKIVGVGTSMLLCILR